jgi:hypothetical protein
MSASVTTHFHLKMGDIELDVEGEREFVEKVYRMLMLDVERVRADEFQTAECNPPEDDIAETLTWVHRCSELLHKIYLIKTSKLSASLLNVAFDVHHLGALYVDRAAIDRILPSLTTDNTIYAQLTPAGKRKIAAMSNPNPTG